MKQIAYWVGILLLVVSTFWVTASTLGGAEVISWWPISFAMILQLMTVASAVEVWRRAVRLAAGRDVGWRSAALHVCLNLVGKYLPGKIWGFAMRHRTLTESGSSNMQAVGALAVEQASLLASAAVLSLPSIAVAIRSIPQQPGIAAGIVVLIALGLLAMLCRRRLAWWMRFDVTQLRQLPKLAMLNVMQWVISGASMVFIAIGLGCDLDLRAAVTIASAVPAAVVAGMAAFFAPGGIGVREGVLVLLCGPVIGIGPALACALWLRVVATVRDLVCGVGIPLLVRTRRIQAEP